MKKLFLVILIPLALFGQAVEAQVVVTDVTYSQYNTMLTSGSNSADSFVRAGGGLVSQLTVKHDGIEDATADHTWSDGGTVRITESYSGGQWSLSDGTQTISTRPTSSFSMLVLAADANFLQTNLTLTNILLDGQTLPDVSVSQAGTQFVGYAFAPANMDSFVLSYDFTPTWNPSIGAGSGNSWYSDFLATQNGVAGVTVVPEPPAVALILAGLGLIAILRFLKRKTKANLLKTGSLFFMLSPLGGTFSPLGEPFKLSF